jgi:hypothetical protein
MLDPLGGPIVAMCVAAIIGVLAPVLGVPVNWPPHQVAAAVPVFSSMGGMSVPSGSNGLDRGANDGSGTNDAGIDGGVDGGVDGGIGGEPPVASPTEAPIASSPSQAVDPAAPSGVGTNRPGTPDLGDGSTPPAPSPSGSSAVAITIDPAAGSVSVDGVEPALGAPSPLGVPVVQEPAAGVVACGDLGACQPVTISNPVSGP